MLFSHHHWLEPMKYSSLNVLVSTLKKEWKTGALSQREVHVKMSVRKTKLELWNLGLEMLFFLG